ncbi:hypothetical protein K438DRAFT_2135873, partial [Mycena galopus ATCC 62051]
QTPHNLYLCFDLCTGSELFDRICAKGSYYEADATSLVRTIMTAVSYIHASGIVRRDLKPENLLSQGGRYYDCGLWAQSDYGGREAELADRDLRRTGVHGVRDLFENRLLQARRRLGHGRRDVLPPRRVHAV